LARVTTALLSSMMMAGSSRGIRSSWQRAMRKFSSLASVKNRSCFGVCGGGGDGGLFDAAIVECARRGAVKVDSAAGVSFTVEV